MVPMRPAWNRSGGVEKEKRNPSCCEWAEHLDVEERGGVDGDAVLLVQILRHLHLVLLLDRLDGALEAGVRRQRPQLLQLVQVRDPVLADLLLGPEKTRSELRDQMSTVEVVGLEGKKNPENNEMVSCFMEDGPTSAMTSDRAELQRRSHRRGVIPLVLFWNLAGSIS